MVSVRQVMAGYFPETQYLQRKRTRLTGEINVYLRLSRVCRMLLPKIVTREELQGRLKLRHDLGKKGSVRLLEHVR